MGGKNCYPELKGGEERGNQKGAILTQELEEAGNIQEVEREEQKPASKPKPESRRKAGGSKRTSPKKKAAKKAAKKSNAKSADKPPAKSRKNQTADKAKPDPFEVARRRIRRSVPKIVNALAKEAEAGSCTHAKTLLEMTGAKHMFDGEAKAGEKGEPWAKLVLEKLVEAEDGSEQEAASGTREAVPNKIS